MISERDLNLKLFKLVDGSFVIAHVVDDHSELFYVLHWPMSVSDRNIDMSYYLCNSMTDGNAIVLLSSSIIYIANPSNFYRNQYIDFNRSKIARERNA